MKLEDQVANLELSKRLKELGVKQESYFWWNNSIESGGWLLEDHEEANETNAAAFTVAELGALLPEFTIHKKTDGVSNLWRIDLSENLSWIYQPKISDEDRVTEANIRAKLLIHLLEQKLIEVPK